MTPNQTEKINSKKVAMFGININALVMEEAVSLIKIWLNESSRDCRFVVTPNVDHIVKLNNNEMFKKAYQHASLVIADGKPLVWASKLFGEAIEVTVPGSDLVPAIFDRYKQDNQPLKIFLLGAGPGVAEKAKIVIHGQWPTVKVVGIYSPDFGFENNKQESNNICQLINASAADLLVIGLGAPKQELWVNAYAASLKVKVALCVGATIDFIAGEKKRAPALMQILCLEWAYRMMLEPKRLAPRYFLDGLVFPWLLIKEWYLRRCK